MSTTNKPLDPYLAKSSEDPPTAQKISDLKSFITATKYGMLTTLSSDDELLASRCMALAGETSLDPILHTNLHSPKTLDLTTHPHQTNINFLDPVSGAWASLSGTAHILADRPTVEKYYSPALSAWFGDLGDGVHDGGPGDPRIGVIRIEVVEAVHAVARGGVLGRAVETVKSVASGDVPGVVGVRYLGREEVGGCKSLSSLLFLDFVFLCSALLEDRG
ncbi:blue light-inducible protein Bli-3 [Aspergillus ellipticus CBS 707.79]|uniref:Blue light-inducible protein Bli-3 n=1 Tax=Aspergillus ellipticus CBS 707.79 TaxID=1448320 RepID=A0A319E7W3_9EURO|nr:blue light-inducible protein Bli-3 [Aspergillus ellipticus CBS 707.79]